MLFPLFTSLIVQIKLSSFVSLSQSITSFTSLIVQIKQHSGKKYMPLFREFTSLIVQIKLTPFLTSAS